MLHPLLTSADGSLSAHLAEIGDNGAWSGLAFSSRWGDGACGMFDASWQMPLPPNFDHRLLRRGTRVELMDGPYRVGSPLVLAQPARGSGYDEPWQFVATGVGREVEGESSFYALNGSGAATTIPSEAVDRAVAATRGWAIAGRAASVPTTQVGASATSDGLQTVGALLSGSADSLGQRWGVGQDNYLRFMTDPVGPSHMVVPGAAALGVADDEYASVVLGRYFDSGSATYDTVFAENTKATGFYRRREWAVDLTPLGSITEAAAQAFVDGLLAKTKGRLQWTNGMTLTSNDLLTIGGGPADLTKAAEAAGSGMMVRLHGVWDELLELTGNTYLDVIIGEARKVDDEQVVQLNPLGLAPRDLAAVFESVTGMAAAA